MAKSDINVLTLTASEAQKLLTSGTITSVDLVEAYLAQIERHNHSGLHLNALISVAPRAILLDRARHLDTERRAGRTLGALHGIPFITKDVFVTHPSTGLPTTAGAPCFRSAKAKRTAPLLQHLMDNHGMILLGKANLTEFCGLKMPLLTPGWSPAGGQTQNPYIFGGLVKGEKILGHSSAGGSSSGSAAGVAAGFAPLSIGTEVCGSLITPANRAGVYALKCGLGEVDDRGCWKYTDCLDHVGAMAKGADDLAAFTAALMQRPEPFGVGGGFKGMKVAFTDPKIWRLSGDYSDWPGDTRRQMERGFAEVVAKVRELGANVNENVELSTADELFKYDGKSVFYEISFYQIKKTYIQNFIAEFGECEVQSLEDIIKYNEAHKEECMPPEHPSQEELQAVLDYNGTAESISECLQKLRSTGRALDKILSTQGHDVLVAFSDSSLVRYSSAAGYPIACAPLKPLKYSEDNERPYGLCMVAGKGQEGVLIRFMAAWEQAFPPRPLPRPLLKGQSICT